jgi:5-methylcytosine-specific restriction endonuclease McrA
MQSTAQEPTLAKLTHGTRTGYEKRRCRCELCKAWSSARSRQRTAQRRSHGEQPDPGKVANVCRMCGTHFTSRRKQSYCNRDCYLSAIGTAPLTGWWVSTGRRLAIYHRDGYRCQLCGDPVDMCAEPNEPKAATLDHIIPRARGGADEPDNLRLAHRECNVQRGSAIDDYVITP